ncbi:hypothetical protein SynBOUM118_01223 [Synechococcus sp. BOUM118]|nr:hypothetical protein SynBOUM118_01223 [Synechococcus sp. BOUM118]
MIYLSRSFVLERFWLSKPLMERVMVEGTSCFHRSLTLPSRQ